MRIDSRYFPSDRHRGCRHVVGSALVLAMTLAVPTPALGRDEGTDLRQRLQGEVAEQGEQLGKALERQDEYQSQTETLEQQLERGRQLRAMHREAVLLAELNLAWIQDQLAHWDCRVAERKVAQARTRIEELSGFQGRLNTLCSDLGSGDSHQSEVCTRQRRQVADSLQALEQLAGRYQSACAAEPARQSDTETPTWLSE